jgi:hemerythrin superfamily protein
MISVTVDPCLSVSSYIHRFPGSAQCSPDCTATNVARGSQVNAVKLLKEDHRQVATLFEQFEKADDDERGEIAAQVCQMLTVHAQIEEELLYPAARGALNEQDVGLVDEATVEHASVKDLVGQIESAESSDELFDAKIKVLGEYVTHHVKEEEGELFPKLEKSELDLEALGDELEARKTELTSAMDGPTDREEESAPRHAPKSAPRTKGSNRTATR